MFLEKNPVTRRLYRNLLSLDDRVLGTAFPKMKRVKQITPYHCGPAVIAVLFSYVGLVVSQTSMVRSLRAGNRIKNYGLTVKDLSRAARIAGKGKFTFWKKSNSKVRDLDTIINKYKYPVGVEWQGVFYEHEDEDNGHYGVITRIDKKAGTLRLADPFSAFAGVDRKFKIKDFTGRWWDENEISVAGTRRKRKISDNKVMFLITPKGESWPKKLGMTRAS